MLHRYTVDLVISGDDLEESEVSAILGLKPSMFLKKGERLSPGVTRDISSWSYQFDPPEGKPEWQSLEAGLRSMVQRLQPFRSALDKLSERFQLQAYCGHFGSGFGGGPSISRETLRQLADLGLTLTLKTYWRSLEPEG